MKWFCLLYVLVSATPSTKDDARFCAGVEAISAGSITCEQMEAWLAETDDTSCDRPDKDKAKLSISNGF